MKSSLILHDSIIRDCWKLLVDKGLLNRERVRSKIIYGWERCRLLAVDPYQKINRLSPARLPRTELKLDNAWLEKCAHQKVAVMISDRDNQVRFTNLTTSVFNAIRVQTVLNEQATGNLSIYLSRQSNAQEMVFGAEHFLSELHHIVDITIPIDIENGVHYLTYFTTIGSYRETLVDQLNTLSEQLAKNLTKTPSTIKPVASTTCIDRISIDLHGTIIAQTGVNLPFRDKDNLFMKLDDTTISSMQTGLPTLLHLNEDMAYIATLCAQTERYSDYLIRPTSDIGHLQQQLPINKLQNKTKNLDKAVKQTLRRFAKHQLAVLFVGNDQVKINAKINYLYHIMQTCNQIQVFDCRLSYQLFDECTTKSIFRQLIQLSQSQMIVITHLETLNVKQQETLMQQINSTQRHLKDNHIKLVLTIALTPLNVNANTRYLIKQFEMRVDYSYLVHDMVIDASQSAASMYATPHTSVNLEMIEKNAIEEALRLAKGNRRQAAKQLGIGRTTLYRKIKQYNL